jgi:hypothetical protein
MDRPKRQGLNLCRLHQRSGWCDTLSSANTFIPSPKAGDLDACPPVYYATAFLWHLTHLWRFRITFPVADILQHCDDVDSIFRRVLYPPDLAIAFAYVFRAFLLIPVGQVFGSRSAPSYFSLLSNIRAFMATCADLITGYPLHPLAAAAELPDEPLLSALVPAISDSLNPPLSELEAASHSNCCFVDDNGVAGLHTNIVDSVHNSIISTFLLFGWPRDDGRSSCLAPGKWESNILSEMMYLGFSICSRSMTVTWPFYKRNPNSIVPGFMDESRVFTDRAQRPDAPTMQATRALPMVVRSFLLVI